VWVTLRGKGTRDLPALQRGTDPRRFKSRRACPERSEGAEPRALPCTSRYGALRYKTVGVAPTAMFMSATLVPPSALLAWIASRVPGRIRTNPCMRHLWKGNIAQGSLSSPAAFQSRRGFDGAGCIVSVTPGGNGTKRAFSPLRRGKNPRRWKSRRACPECGQAGAERSSAIS